MFIVPVQQRTEADRAQELAEIKKRALAKQAEQQQLRLVDDSDDDDLEIVHDMKLAAAEETGQRRAIKARHTHISEGRKRQIMLARVNVSQGRKNPPVRKAMDSIDRLKAMVQPSFSTSARDRRGKGMQYRDQLTQPDLNRILLKEVTETNIKIDQAKEAEWKRLGGKAPEHLRQEGGDLKGLEIAQKTYAEKALTAMMATPQHEEDSDEEWTPETNESASPSRNESEDEAQTKDEDAGMNSEDEVVEAVEPDGDDNGEYALRGPRGPRRAVKRPRAVHDSDEDDDSQNKPISTPSGQGGMPPPRQLPKILHRPSFSSFDDPTEDEADKENNTILMYDKSEDKENTAVVRHALGGVRGGPLSANGLTKNVKTPLSPSPGAVLSDDESEVGERTPFKELLDDPFTSPTLRNDIPFTTRLQQASSTLLAPQASLAPQPLDLGMAGVGFSQFLDENDNSENSPATPPLPAPPLGGLSQAFDFGTEPTTLSFPKQKDSHLADNDNNDVSCNVICAHVTSTDAPRSVLLLITSDHWTILTICHSRLTFIFNLHWKSARIFDVKLTRFLRRNRFMSWQLPGPSPQKRKHST